MCFANNEQHYKLRGTICTSIEVIESKLGQILIANVKEGHRGQLFCCYICNCLLMSRSQWTKLWYICYVPSYDNSDETEIPWPKQCFQVSFAINVKVVNECCSS